MFDVAMFRVRGNRGTLPLLLLCMAQFMLIVDVAIVNVALPSEQEDLGFAPADLQLVVTAYALFLGGLLLLSRMLCRSSRARYPLRQPRGV